MKYWAIKTFWFFVNPIKKLYWFLFRPKTRGVKCLVENNGKFLLVKLNYAHHKWTFPGGGVGRKELFLDAAIREVKEETGINVNNLVYVGFYETNREYKKDMVEIYLASSDILDVKIDPIEIEKADWFSRDNLPENRGPAVDKIFKIYDESRPIKN
jgi:ADP-ribose pyrophosphatase YjhB (NUDIX family)